MAAVVAGARCADGAGVAGAGEASPETAAGFEGPDAWGIWTPEFPASAACSWAPRSAAVVAFSCIAWCCCATMRRMSGAPPEPDMKNTAAIAARAAMPNPMASTFLFTAVSSPS